MSRGTRLHDLLHTIRNIEIKTGNWEQKFMRIHSDFSLCQNETERLRLVIGVGRSGTTWVSRVLSETDTPIRFIMEGVYAIKPWLRFSEFTDRTAIGYTSGFEGPHVLSTAYKAFLGSSEKLKKYGMEKILFRNDPGWKYCLDKEIHGLLATEALLSELGGRCLFLIRNPVYVIDSLFARDGIESIYLINESNALRDQYFLDRFLKDQKKEIKRVLDHFYSYDNKRMETIIKRAMTVGAIQIMLQTLSKENPNTMVFKYEQICEKPEELFPKIFHFFSFNFGANAKEFLKTTLEVNAEREKADYEIFRNTARQIKREYMFITEEEGLICSNALTDCGITV